MNLINTVLVDDHNIIIDGLTLSLKSNEQVNIVGRANTPDELYEILKNEQVQLILLDIFLPKPIGIEVLKAIKKSSNLIKVIIVSGNEEEELISIALQEGASAFLSKNITATELNEAIKQVLDGEIYISLAIQNKLSKNFIKKAIHGDKYSHFKVNELSQREIEIIKLLCEGLSYKEVAANLGISSRTVEAHKNNILGKLDLKNTIELVKFAIKNKLIEL